MFNMSSQNTFGKVKLNDKVESRVRGDLYARFGGECLETYHCNKWQGAGCLAYGEMLRLLLKRFIILCTRLARKQLSGFPVNEKGFDIIQRYYVLVDNHFKEKKQVQAYAALLHRSPKTLSNLFAAYGMPSPLKIIQERVVTEAKRLLLHTSHSIKEISVILGFESVGTFSRFFKNMTGENTSAYRKRLQ